MVASQEFVRLIFATQEMMLALLICSIDYHLGNQKRGMKRKMEKECDFKTWRMIGTKVSNSKMIKLHRLRPKKNTSSSEEMLLMESPKRISVTLSLFYNFQKSYSYLQKKKKNYWKLNSILSKFAKLNQNLRIASYRIYWIIHESSNLCNFHVGALFSYFIFGNLGCVGILPLCSTWWSWKFYVSSIL